MTETEIIRLSILSFTESICQMIIDQHHPKGKAERLLKKTIESVSNKYQFFSVSKDELKKLAFIINVFCRETGLDNKSPVDFRMIAAFILDQIEVNEIPKMEKTIFLLMELIDFMSDKNDISEFQKGVMLSSIFGDVVKPNAEI